MTMRLPGATDGGPVQEAYHLSRAEPRLDDDASGTGIKSTPRQSTHTEGPGDAGEAFRSSCAKSG